MACCLNGVTIKFHSFIHSYTASNLSRMRVFSCNTAVISVRICAWSCFVIRDLMLTSEESSYGMHWLLLANSRTQGTGGATRFEKDAVSRAISMLLPSLTWVFFILFCWRYIARFSSPDRLSALSLGTYMCAFPAGEWLFTAQDQCTGVQVYNIAVR